MKKRAAAQLDATSFWIDGGRPASYPKLDAHVSCEIAVIGSGIAGLTSAYLLAAAGRDVVVLERGTIGGVDSSFTTAHLTMVTDERLSALEDRLGRDHAQAVWDAGLAAIDQIDAIVQAERIDCDFTWVPGYLHAAVNASADDVEQLKREAAVAAAMGFDAEFLDAVPFVRLPGIRFEGQAHFHPGKLPRGQGRVVERGGKRVAAYRDLDGALTLRSAVCTHMGCVVGWNTAERTWDCPCHGSRFLPDGSVMSGPAEQPLAPADDE